MKITGLIAVLLMTSVHAFAAEDFTGVWTGKGIAVDHSGNQYPECSFRFEFKQTATEFTMVSGYYDCGIKRDYSFFSVEIRGNDLYLNGEKIGTFDGEKIHAVAGGNGFNTEYNIALKNGKLTYQEKLTFSDDPGSLTVTGNLTKE